MGSIITLAGLLLGIAIFLYLVNLLDEGKQKIKKIKKNKIFSNTVNVTNITEENRELSDGEKPALRDFPNTRNLPDDLKNQMPGRRCPLCGKTLKRDEPLYATNIEVGKIKKILIYGCQYCHKDREPEEMKKQDQSVEKS